MGHTKASQLFTQFCAKMSSCGAFIHPSMGLLCECETSKLSKGLLPALKGTPVIAALN